MLLIPQNPKKFDTMLLMSDLGIRITVGERLRSKMVKSAALRPARALARRAIELKVSSPAFVARINKLMYEDPAGSSPRTGLSADFCFREHLTLARRE